MFAKQNTIEMNKLKELKEKARRLGVTQKEIANAIGVTEATVNATLNNRFGAKYKTVIDIDYYLRKCDRCKTNVK